MRIRGTEREIEALRPATESYRDLAIQLKRWHHQLRLDARLPLAPWWPSGVCPDFALSAVIDRGSDGLSHWALRHGEQADFHRRSTFLQA